MGHTVVSKHMLLPNSENFLQLPEFPFARVPFVTIDPVQIHVVELEHHREFLTLFGDILARLVFVHAARHLTNSAVGVFRKDSAIHLVHVFMNIGAKFGQHLYQARG